LVKKGGFLKKDLSYLSDQQHQLSVQQTIQKKDYTIAGEEYAMHKNLEQQKVETPAELRQEESKYLAKKTAVLQTESLMLTGDNNYATKQNEISELNNQIQQEKAKFLQALNSLISSVEDWKSKYVLIASESGKLSFSGMLQENQVLSTNQEVFYINPGDEAFYGEMAIAQSNMGKVNVGQQVLVKLRSYPFEEYGMIRGRIEYISDIPYKDSVFISRVSFKTQHSSDLKKPIRLKQGMVADAEIITEDATILQRLTRNMIKIFKKE
jgi:HlyD family secretion protein